MRRGTQATAIAAFEARRNEEETLAAGALASERRAAITRLAMVVLFGVCAEAIPQLRDGRVHSEPSRMIVGVLYTVWAIAIDVVMGRVKPNVRHARVRPIGLTLLDFAFITFMGLSDQRGALGFRPELAAASGAVDAASGSTTMSPAIPARRRASWTRRLRAGRSCVTRPA